LLRDPWSIGIYRGTSPFDLRSDPDCANPILTREDIDDVNATFVADPFLVREGALWHLFFEVLNHDTQRGEIGLAISPDARGWSYKGIVLREPFHLSYPYVFSHDGEIYMMPETLGAGSVRLYRADPFPGRWSLVADLIPRALADPSPFFRDGEWWLFACPRANDHDALSLFRSIALTGPWSEHPGSPVLRGDRRTARPAGRVIEYDGRLYRFAQDCFPRYGNAVRAFEVTSLTPTSYAEAEYAVEPILRASGAGWNGKGMHHVDPHLLAGGGWLAAVDGLQA
jgi:hypothetical protein